MGRKTTHRTCQFCKKDFLALQSEVKRGKAKYCSISCGVAFRNKSIALKPEEVFFNNISKENHSNGCWIYQVGRRYGKMKIGTKYMSAHRFSYEFHKGKIKDGMVICHSCDNKLCVNPDHLFIGTQKDNIQDMLSKDRGNHAKGSNHHNTQLNEQKVSDIKILLNKGFSIKEVSDIYKVSYSTIAQIKQERSWIYINPRIIKEP